MRSSQRQGEGNEPLPCLIPKAEGLCQFDTKCEAAHSFTGEPQVKKKGRGQKDTSIILMSPSSDHNHSDVPIISLFLKWNSGVPGGPRGHVQRWHIWRGVSTSPSLAAATTTSPVSLQITSEDQNVTSVFAQEIKSDVFMPLEGLQKAGATSAALLRPSKGVKMSLLVSWGN